MADRRNQLAGRMVRWAAEAVIQSSKLGVRATWSILYVMIAIAGWRTYLQEINGPALQVWLGQMVLNFLWSPIVFRLHSLAMGLSVIVLLLGLILFFIVLQRQANRLAALLFVNRRSTGTPYRHPKVTPLIGVLCW
uniref:Tryptophan-rich sensory protein n=1 Tax=Bradyrhizobium quebecense TaxID=2748629 RepID=A0A974AD80_9BRAD